VVEVLAAGRADDAPHVRNLAWSASSFSRFVVDSGGTRLIQLDRGQVRRWAIDPAHGTIGGDGGDAALGPASSLALGPDGRTLALGRDTGEITLVNAATGQVLARINPPGDEPGADPRRRGSSSPFAALKVTALAISTDGRSLAAGNIRGDLELWDVGEIARPRRILGFPGQRGIVGNLAFDAAGRYLAAAEHKLAQENAVEVWDLGLLRGELERLGLGW
jgi:WD40 repeat protein